MLLSLDGLLVNASDALATRHAKTKREILALLETLRCVAQRRGEGEAIIDALFRDYPHLGPLHDAIGRLPSRPTRALPQPGLMRFSLGELAKHLEQVRGRKAEGTAVLDEFFAVYVFEEGK